MIQMITDSSRLDARYKDLVSQHVTPLLRGFGFRKKGAEYCRVHEGLSHLVSIQTSQWNDESSLQFTINCGVLVPGVTEVYAKKKAASPKIEDCSLSTRVGFLTCEETDLWWVLSASDHEGDGAIGQDIVDKLRELVLPFLDQFNTTEEVIAFLTDTQAGRFALPRSRVQRLAYAAIISAKDGQLGRARRLIASAKSEGVGSPIARTIDRVEEQISR